jgi:Beta-ketoacyl synthase, N-terminal domain
MRVIVESVGLIGPGLPDWKRAVAILRGEAGLDTGAMLIAPPARLPAAERRRVGLSVKLAIAVAEQAFEPLPANRAAQTISVFASSGGDGDNCHALCEALASPDPMVSPTRFTNSVHNAPAGYWSIATGAMSPSSSLCAYDASFCAGLIEAATYVTTEDAPVALIAYDVPYPEPLNSQRPIVAAFGVALILLPWHAKAGLARLEIGRYRDGIGDRLTSPALEALRAGVPAARALPLLIAIANRQAATVRLDAFPAQMLDIEVRPCA